MQSVPDIDEHRDLHVGDWDVDSDSGYIHKNRVSVKLEPKVMQVLLCLAQNRGKVVSRDTLLATAWPDMVVGYDAVSSSIIKLRKALGDDSRNPIYIETVSKKGYRLIARTEWRPPGSEAVEDKAEQGEFTASPKPGRSTVVYIAVALIVMAVAGLTYHQMSSRSLPAIRYDTSGDSSGLKPVSTRTKPSIVVLPFHNLSEDPEQEYFSDGITDDLITDLSKVAALRVVARQSAEHYKNSKLSLHEIGLELNVLYILQGSIQKDGSHIRINIQLTDVAKGETVWAERFEGESTNIFNFQDEITQRTIDAMFVTLSSNEQESVKFHATNDFEAYDYFLRGQQHFRNRTKEGFEQARDAYRQAIELDPRYARAYGSLAVALTNAYRFQWTSLSMEEARSRAVALINTAISLDNTSPQVRWSAGFVHLFRKEFDKAEAEALQAIKLSPNYADGYALLAFILNWRGKAEKAIDYINKATALNPYHTYDYPWNLGLAYFTLGRYKESIQALQEALERNETAVLPRLYLAANYVRLGRHDDAEWEVEQAMTEKPDVTISLLSNTLPYEPLGLKNAVLEDLKTAGMPE